MTPIIAVECKVRTRFWASLDGWPGTFRPSGFKQTQIPLVMAIPVGPFPSPKPRSHLRRVMAAGQPPSTACETGLPSRRMCCLSNNAMTRNEVGTTAGGELSSLPRYDRLIPLCLALFEMKPGPPAVVLAWFLMNPWQTYYKMLGPFTNRQEPFRVNDATGDYQ